MKSFENNGKNIRVNITGKVVTCSEKVHFIAATNWIALAAQRSVKYGFALNSQKPWKSLSMEL